MSAETEQDMVVSFYFPSCDMTYKAKRLKVDGVASVAVDLQPDEYRAIVVEMALQKGLWMYGTYSYVPCFFTPDPDDDERDPENEADLFYLIFDSKTQEFSFEEGEMEDYNLERPPVMRARWVTTAECLLPKVFALYQAYQQTKSRNLAESVKKALEGVNRPYPRLYTMTQVLEGAERTCRAKEYGLTFMDGTRLLLLKNGPQLDLGRFKPRKLLKDMTAAEFEDIDETALSQA